MATSEFKYTDRIVILELSEELEDSYKIKSYEQKLNFMEKKKIPQKPFEEVVSDFFLKNTVIPKQLKNEIIKIKYSPKNKIIIVILKGGNSRKNSIIWNRDKLIKQYGWFFFVSLSEEIRKPKKKEAKKKKSREKKKQEQTVKEEIFQLEEISFVLKEKVNMRPLYKTKEYRHYQNVLESNKINQIPIKEVLEDLFQTNELIPLKEKSAIKKVIYYQEEKVVVVKSLIGDQMFENLENLVKQYGWYFYITGVPVGQSDISLAIDKIERKYSLDLFKTISLVDPSAENKKISISLFPISSKPNYNCVLLSLGSFNILLDCGINEEDLSNIEIYLQKKDKLNQNNIENQLEDREKIDNSAVSENSSDEEISNQKIDAIFLSHSHYDHISALKDLIKLYPNIPILCSRITLDLYLLRDSGFLKQDNFDKIEEEEYINVIRNVIYVENGSKLDFKEKDCFLSFFHAGHMPGALMILAKTKDYRFLYTGDYTYYDITPFAGTRRFLEQISRPIDYLLMDATSIYENFGDPSEQFHSLILFLEQKAEYGDTSLIGADPSSLAITFMLRFWRYFRKLQLRRNYKNRPNIYVDEMVRKNIQVINHRYEYIYGPISFREEKKQYHHFTPSRSFLRID
jgi:glyoxylase-like metal-dependent hydrolase (beta-lactamase superfamily II)